MAESSTVVRYANWVVKHPWLTIIGCLLLVMAFASGGKHLQFKTDYRVFFSEDNPQLLNFDALETNYTKNDNVMFILAPKTGDAFDNETLEELFTELKSNDNEKNGE